MKLELSELSPAAPPVKCVPHVVWMLAALIVVVLSAAALASASATDTRDFAAKHRTVLSTQAL